MAGSGLRGAKTQNEVVVVVEGLFGDSKVLGLHQKVWVKKDVSVPNCCVKPQVKISITRFARPAALI